MKQNELNKESNFPKGLAKPALRALEGAGYKQIEQLTKVTEAEILKLHGMGPNAVRKLCQALLDKGLAFANE
jgi:DNA-directed RNA polymerase alpha subunit